MISRLTGQVVHTESKYIVLDVAGVGYKVFVSAELLPSKEKNVTLWTYLAVRENALDLYGFTSLKELDFFELLITISGIGPKTAMGILSIASIESIQTAIQTEDPAHLTKMSGVGKKVAEKIVHELKDKVITTSRSPEQEQTMKNDADALEALKSLGYSQSESRDALKKLPKNITKTNDKVREALKGLGK